MGLTACLVLFLHLPVEVVASILAVLILEMAALVEVGQDIQPATNPEQASPAKEMTEVRDLLIAPMMQAAAVAAEALAVGVHLLEVETVAAGQAVLFREEALPMLAVAVEPE